MIKAEEYLAQPEFVFWPSELIDVREREDIDEPELDDLTL
jgi:hypothetical protein